MKIEEIKKLEFPEIKVIRYKRHNDQRGYFSVPFVNKVFSSKVDNVDFVQLNESYSKRGIFRGMHIQIDPPQGKLVRTIYGSMIDFVMDVRKDSLNYGKIIGYEMTEDKEKEYNEWIWVPPGFAHGNLYLKETRIEYLCTAEYNPSGEYGLSIFGNNIDWSLCDKKIKKTFDSYLRKGLILSDKDKSGLNLNDISVTNMFHNYLEISWS